MGKKISDFFSFSPTSEVPRRKGKEKKCFAKLGLKIAS
jgi:hypothetical protein